ncbi:unnamed protein product [Periconia digitata]|uniref:Uncharacterized protein n=1 Tax=Periconia digitata TaxID=1303443 RepID=A0A9W4UAZ9_9PLEO|nr:unnamed protein product [Periconia digitata]
MTPASEMEKLREELRTYTAVVGMLLVDLETDPLYQDKFMKMGLEMEIEKKKLLVASLRKKIQEASGEASQRKAPKPTGESSQSAMMASKYAPGSQSKPRGGDWILYCSSKSSTGHSYERPAEFG